MELEKLERKPTERAPEHFRVTSGLVDLAATATLGMTGCTSGRLSLPDLAAPSARWDGGTNNIAPLISPFMRWESGIPFVHPDWIWTEPIVLQPRAGACCCRSCQLLLHLLLALLPVSLGPPLICCICPGEQVPLSLPEAGTKSDDPPRRRSRCPRLNDRGGGVPRRLLHLLQHQT